MRHTSYIAGAAALAVALAGCGDPYNPRYGNSQSYYSPLGYGYAPSRSDYCRNYNGIHAAPERFP